jgi:hypothetical protein
MTKALLIRAEMNLALERQPSSFPLLPLAFALRFGCVFFTDEWRFLKGHAIASNARIA